MPLASPARPNSLTSYYVTLAAAQHIDLNIVLEAGSNAILKDAIMQAALCTINPKQMVAREIASGAMRASRIVRPTIAQTTWLALGSQRPLSAAARVVARLILELAKRPAIGQRV